MLRGKEYYIANDLAEIAGLNATRVTHALSSNTYSETIEILATAHLDGTPLECMFKHYRNPRKNDYSKFATLMVNTVENG